METMDGPTPTEAKALLDAAASAESQTHHPPLPWSFFIAQSVLIAALCCAQLLPSRPASVLTILGLLLMVALGLRSVFARPGYGIVWPDGAATFPYLLLMFALVGVPAILAVSTEFAWLWLVAGVLGAVATIDMGRRYRRASRHA